MLEASPSRHFGGTFGHAGSTSNCGIACTSDSAMPEDVPAQPLTVRAAISAVAVESSRIIVRSFVVAVPEDTSISGELQIRPHARMIGRPERRIVLAWTIEAHAALDHFRRARNPNVIDAAIHPGPVGMRDLAIRLRKQRECCWRG